eukprot:TRINITY_DN1453_c0_g1_i6.p1 TRINITY_DN1453_c0_g1~~TRINITY_DN1453_c0_g1_i6.p1  ORF type:complete len:694 (+),score=187.56 TRINITY_DN1453_c0_g1_i6:31-2082(+)
MRVVKRQCTATGAAAAAARPPKRQRTAAGAAAAAETAPPLKKKKKLSRRELKRERKEAAQAGTKPPQRQRNARKGNRQNRQVHRRVLSAEANAEKASAAEMEAAQASDSAEGPCTCWNLLDDRLRTILTDSMNITELFPVQHAVISNLFGVPCPKCQHADADAPSNTDNATATLNERTQDLLVCAPTGTGKTLAYALPVCHVLLQRKVVTRLRCLVLVPTRELAQQVHVVITKLCHNTILTVGAAYGQVNFQNEQQVLVGGCDRSDSSEMAGSPPAGGSSLVDVLVATPGRLIEHMHSTPAFTLQHVIFLVIDEADKLLAQGYQDWVNKIVPVVGKPPPPVTSHALVDPRNLQELRVHKMLFSATLTKNPLKLEPLHMHNPRTVVLGGTHQQAVPTTRFFIPEKLKEEIVVLGTRLPKPAALLHILSQRSCPVLCFTNSLQMSRRLHKVLLRMLQSPAVAAAAGLSGTENAKNAVGEYSSLLPQRRRTEMISRFSAGSIRLLVASDAVARGIDLPGVDCVVNFEPPRSEKVYMHRAGRTARAGREGECLTLVRGPTELEHATAVIDTALTASRKASQHVKTSKLHKTEKLVLAFKALSDESIEEEQEQEQEEAVVAVAEEEEGELDEDDVDLGEIEQKPVEVVEIASSDDEQEGITEEQLEPEEVPQGLEVVDNEGDDENQVQ